MGGGGFTPSHLEAVGHNNFHVIKGCWLWVAQKDVTKIPGALVINCHMPEAILYVNLGENEGFTHVIVVCHCGNYVLEG